MSKSAAKGKFYVVWKGRQTGIFSGWEACKAQVNGFTGAEYKAFQTRQEAERAFAGEYASYRGKPASTQKWLFAPHPPLVNGYVVDAACSSRTGRLEWRGVRLADGEPLFHQGPYADGTNNVGEFLALVQALRLLEQNGEPLAVYSDSETAMAWVKKGQCNTDLEPNGNNASLFAMLEQAEQWLASHPAHARVLKWDTRAWGENPADFNRK
jgi:ribonuclease HI